MGKRRRYPAETWVDYLIEVTNWSWSYTLYRADTSLPLEAHDIGEFRHLELDGRLHEPDLANCKGSRLTLIPVRDFDFDRTSKAIGSVSLHDGVLAFYATIPNDALPCLLTCLCAERLKFVRLHGAKLRYGKAQIQSMNVAESRDDV